MDYVVDASVAVKWLLPEIHSAAAELLLAEQHALFAPDLLYAEAANVLWKRVVRREIGETLARDALRHLLDVDIDITAADVLAEEALTIACAHRRPVYDSLYIALARQRDALLVTADRRLYNAMRDTEFAESLLWVADLEA